MAKIQHLNKDKLINAIAEDDEFVEACRAYESKIGHTCEIAEIALRLLAKAVPYPTYSVEVVNALHHDRVLGNRAVGNEAKLWDELKAMGEE